MVTERQRTDANVARILAHPVRVEILETLLRQGVVSASTIARASDVSLGMASHHIRYLAERKVIRLRNRTPVRGAFLHHYVLTDPETISAVLDVLRASRYPQRAVADGHAGNQRLSTVLRELRESKDVTRADLAARVGLSVSCLGRVERGQADPRVADVSAIAEALGSSIEEVMSEVDPDS